MEKSKGLDRRHFIKMAALSDSTGFLGYMILKQMGVCALGSFMLDPGSIHHVFSTNDGRTWLEVLFAIMKKNISVQTPPAVRRTSGNVCSGIRHSHDRTLAWAGGWGGGVMWLWTVIGVLVMVLLVVLINKEPKK